MTTKNNVFFALILGLLLLLGVAYFNQKPQEIKEFPTGTQVNSGNTTAAQLLADTYTYSNTNPGYFIQFAKFNLSGFIPVGATIVDAKLWLYKYTMSGSPTTTMNFSLLDSNGDSNYSESNLIATLNTYAFDTGALDQNTLSTAAGWQSYNITNITSRSWTTLGRTNLTFILIKLGGTRTAGDTIGSQGYWKYGDYVPSSIYEWWYDRTDQASNYPKIEITYTSSGLAASATTLCNSTACSALGTLYYNNPTSLNASGVCAGTVGPHIGNFSLYRNGTLYSSNLTYAWTEGATNYMNTSLGGTVLKKSDSIYVTLACSDDGTTWSSVSTSTAYTVNNSAPAMTIPSIVSNESGFYNTSKLTCNNGTYSDADSDAINITAYWRWFLNDTTVLGEHTGVLTLTTYKINVTDRINCSVIVNDTGYSMKSAPEAFSTTVTITAPATLTASSVVLCNATACSTIGTTYYNNPSTYNASGVCTGGGTLWGNFSSYINGTYAASYMTYNWVSGQTNYTNTTFLGSAVKKSDTVKVGLVCSNSSGSSAAAYSSSYTINNTAPVQTASSITGNEAGYYNTSILTCQNGTFTDADSDSRNNTAWWRWFLNDTTVLGEHTGVLTLTTYKINATDRINCSVIVNDTGYSMKSAPEAYSNSVTITTVPLATFSPLTVNYLNNYTDWAHYSTSSVGRCAFEVIPEDNKTITSVSFQVKRGDGTYAVGSSSTWVSGTQNPNDWNIWLSPFFTSNAFGVYNCNATVLQSDATTGVWNGTFNVSFYSAAPACDWKKDCSVTISASITGANVSHYYLYIAPGVTLTTSQATTLFMIQDKVDNYGTIQASGAEGSNGRNINISTRTWMNYGNLVLSGGPGSGWGGNGRNGGILYLTAGTFFNNTVSGTIQAPGGGGQQCDYHTMGAPGIGGTGGSINTSMHAQINSTGTITLDGGRGGDGCNNGYSCTNGGAGGTGGSWSIDGVSIIMGNAHAAGGAGGTGQWGNGHCCSYGGPGGNGATNYIWARATLTATANINCDGGGGGDYNHYGCSGDYYGEPGSPGSFKVYNSTTVTGFANFAETPTYTTITAVSATAPAAPTITAPPTGTNLTAWMQNVSLTWTAVSGLTYELEILNNGTEILYEPLRNMQLTLTYPSLTTGAYNFSTHRVLKNNTLNVLVRAYNATNKMFGPWATRVVNLSYVNTTLGTWISPSGATLNTNDIEYWCSYNDTTNTKPVYSTTIRAMIDGIGYNMTWVPTRGAYLYNTTGLGLISAGPHNYNCSVYRADYGTNLSANTAFTITGFSVSLPNGTSTFRWTCPFPIFANATPAGQKIGIGIYRIQNYNNTKNKNYTMWINGTIPTGINFYVANVSSRNWAIKLSGTPQQVLKNIAYTNLTAYLWMWIDCIGAPIGAPTVKFGFNETDGAT